MDSARPGITRRTALRAAAWSAPVIAVAAASPLAAASEHEGPALDLGVLLSTLPTAPAKAHQIRMKVYDFADTNQTWAGSFTLDYHVAPDDSVVYINPSVILGVGPASSPTGWSFIGLGGYGPNGATVARYTFSGTIPAGGAAELAIEDPYLMNLKWVGSSGAFATTRSALITDVAGVPNTDTASYNSDSQPITYTP
ncbi:MAG: hypothetical protein IJO71_10990 [Microbacterium sp.]|jgi:hypothetical protein|uniref:hypothetical protein n=1 Tax=Microbacterium sp. TaxID=51671 RepID=UPI0025F9A811|nr:hypothetical protein [Microbacterium sp.]MBQ9917707.1 hypothetical protein [Microbacterium sp.]